MPTIASFEIEEPALEDVLTTIPLLPKSTQLDINLQQPFNKPNAIVRPLQREVKPVSSENKENNFLPNVEAQIIPHGSRPEPDLAKGRSDQNLSGVKLKDLQRKKHVKSKFRQ